MNVTFYFLVPSPQRKRRSCQLNKALTRIKRADLTTTAPTSRLCGCCFSEVSCGSLKYRTFRTSLKEALRVGQTVGGAFLVGVHCVHHRLALCEWNWHKQARGRRHCEVAFFPIEKGILRVYEYFFFYLFILISPLSVLPVRSTKKTGRTTSLCFRHQNGRGSRIK